jgi:enoyl-CoA hydratase/carnithine racemase
MVRDAAPATSRDSSSEYLASVGGTLIDLIYEKLPSVTSRRPRIRCDALEAAFGLAGRITRFSSAAVASCLHAVTRGLNATISEGLAIEAEAFARMVTATALREGLDRFLTARA